MSRQPDLGLHATWIQFDEPMPDRGMKGTTMNARTMKKSVLMVALMGTSAVPLAGYAANDAAPSVSSSDKKFVEKAAQGGMAEVELGQLAAQRAQSDEVKQFAQRMVTDHTAANDKLKQVASQKGIALPGDLDSSSRREFDKLQKLSGNKFDREYMSHMVSDHKKDVKEFESESKSAKDADIKTFAATTLPTLQDHLKMAQSAEAAAKNAPKTALR
jgi:putative membrane protein